MATFVQKVKKRVIDRNPVLRRIQTKNYTVDKLAIGENNDYAFPNDWIKIDYRYADHNIDLNSDYKLPFKDDSLSQIYSAHCLEHLTETKAKYLFEECFRVLKKGGSIRFEVPDAERLISMYKANDPVYLRYFTVFFDGLISKYNFPAKYNEPQMGMIGTIANYIPHDIAFQIPVYISQAEVDEKLQSMDMDEFCTWVTSHLTTEEYQTPGHKSFFYFSKLERILTDIGFSGVIKADFNVSPNGFKLNAGTNAITEKEHRRFFSVYVEAIK